eukprot:CAMPEP_0119012048 /NCGR_PEP_ID=MMETSP1176-20130426/6046_1 /TAXON_ID=265551 /ORGANISM="Synedropsis recta cf, Strain CCMP1620" /LENGTH=518 /DNA_ID=CAMNT_0006964949 /DNA_START=100 /DNA_END=1653 /DNA_ORIENTATION=-
MSGIEQEKSTAPKDNMPVKIKPSATPPATGTATQQTEGSSNRSVKFALNTKAPSARPAPRRLDHGRSVRQKVGKANLKRDVPIFFCVVGFLFFAAWSLGDVGKPPKKGEKRVLSIQDIRKELENVAVEYVREQEGRRRKTECGLFIAESTIPSVGISWYAGRNFDVGDLVMEEGLPLQPPVDGHDMLQQELIMKHHPFMVNVKRRDGTSGPFVATRPIEQGEELFLAFEAHPHSRLGDNHPIFHNIPSLGDYELAEEIFVMEVQTQIYSQGKKTISRNIPRRGLIDRSAGGDKALKMVMNAVKLFNRRVANLLPKKTEKMREDFATSRHYAYNIVNNRTVYWLEVQGKCMDDVVVRDGSLFAQRPIKRNKIIVVAPLYVKRRPGWQEECEVEEEGSDAAAKQEGSQPKELRGACFGNAKSPILLCPLSSASSVKYVPEGDDTACNAKYQWGGWNEVNHQSRKLSPAEVLAERATGLTIDIVAKQDIAVGDEIILDISGSVVATDSVVEMDDYLFPSGW